MRIEERQRSRVREIFDIVKDIFLPSLAVLGYVGTVIGLYQIMDVWAVVVGLVVALGVCIYWWRRCEARKAIGVPVVLTSDEAKIEATKLLRATERSLYYYGGVGFIGEHPEWRKAYEEKLKSLDIKIVRFLDTKPPEAGDGYYRREICWIKGDKCVSGSKTRGCAPESRGNATAKTNAITPWLVLSAPANQRPSGKPHQLPVPASGLL